MLVEVKKCAESRDIKGLRYIFLDSLDVDPTFEKYKEDYELCRNMDGLFEKHQDLSGLIEDKSKWTQGYWEQLKTDLMKNFSEKRFDHMFQVAQVVYAEKIARLVREREKKQEVQRTGDPSVNSTMSGQRTFANREPMRMVVEDAGEVSNPELEQQRRIEAKQRAIEEENRKIEAKQRAQRERCEAVNRADDRKNTLQARDREAKKTWGIALTLIIAVALVVLIIIVLH